MWTAEQRDEFEQEGIVCLRGAFARADADRMAGAIWRFVESNSDARREEPNSWQGWPNGQPPLSFKRLKRSPVFGPFLSSPTVLAALDGILAGAWKSMSPAVQVLMKYPNADVWAPPPTDEWHMDCGFSRPSWPAFAVKLFALVADHEPGGGATLALAGSHRLVDLYTPSLTPTQHGAGKERWGKFLRRFDLLDGLHGPGDERLAEGMPVRMVEMTGAAGDVYVTHLHVFHASSPNAATTPRLMLGKAVVADAPAA